MAKIGRKGFMLAEVVVVAVVIATILVTLYTGINNVSSAYETRNRYYDVDSLYAAMEINDIILRSNITLEDNINGATTIYNWASNLENINESDIQYFEEFYYNETNDKINVYITVYNKDTMLTLKNLNSNATFSDYLDYLSTNLNFEDDYDYMIIVERKEKNDNNDCYYYALKLSY